VSGGVREFAPAKINLALHVIGRRADGYHLLDSLVTFADIGDEVTVWPAQRTTLQVAGPMAGSLESGDGNLVLKAALALARATGRDDLAAALKLDKRLPVASGIGGGCWPRSGRS
jgi:4-diphosphocytidyl-2-C-methyl-D-erythritol kinase